MMNDDYYVNVQNHQISVFVEKIYFHDQDFLNDENEVVNLLVVVEDYLMLMMIEEVEVEKSVMIEKEINEIDDD
jgi:hypothetical protein